MTENQNNMEFLQENEIKEIKIEEVEKLLNSIWDSIDDYDFYNFNKLDWESWYEMYEYRVREKISKLEDIDKQKNFIKDLLNEVRKIQWEELIWNIWTKDTDFLNVWKALDLYNKNFLEKEEITDEMKENSDNIKDPNIKKYVQNEISRLDSEWATINDWTFLILSYIKWKNNDLENKLFRKIHNTTQEQYIKNIMWNEEWYSDYFVQWYNSEIWNFVYTMEDTEEIIINQDNLNNTNQTLLLNYLNYLANKWSSLYLMNKLWINGTKKITEFIKNDLENINVHEDNKEKISQIKNKFEQSWVIRSLESELNIDWISNELLNYANENRELLENSDDYDWEFFYENKESIYNVKKEEKIKIILDYYKQKWEKLDLKFLNPDVYQKYLNNENIKFSEDSIELLDKNIINNNLELLFDIWENIKWWLWYLIIMNKLINLNINRERIKEIIERKWINVFKWLRAWEHKWYEYIKIYLNPENYGDHLSRVESIVDKYKSYNILADNWSLYDLITEEESKIITEYVLKSTYDNTIDIDILFYFMEGGYFGKKWEFFKLPIKNKKYYLKTMDSKSEQNIWFRLFPFFPEEIRWDKEIINKLFENLKDPKIDNFIEKYIDHLTIKDLNGYLNIFKIFVENAPWERLKNMGNIPENVRNKMFNPKIINHWVHTMQKSLEWNIKIDSEFIKKVALDEDWNSVSYYEMFLKLINNNKSFIQNYKYIDSLNNISTDIQSEINSKTENENQKISVNEWLRWAIVWNIFKKVFWSEENEDFQDIKEEILNNKIDWKLLSPETIKNISFKINLIYKWRVSENWEELAKIKFEQLIKELQNLSISNFLDSDWMDIMSREELTDEENKNSKIDLLNILINEYKNLYEDIRKEFPEENQETILEKMKDRFIKQRYWSLNEEEREKIKESLRYFDSIINYEWILIKSEESENLEELNEELENNTESNNILEEWFQSNELNIDYDINDYKNYLEIKNQYNKNNNNKQNNTNTNLNNTETYKTNTETKWYNPELWVIENNGNKIELNNQEKQIVESNPEAIDNIIDFYNLLNDIWLSKLWKIKDQIFNSISNVEWIWFNVDWDYLNENETKIFINKILKSLWIDEIPTVLNIKNFKWEVLDINKTQISWEQERDFIYWETYLEHMFIEKYYPRWSAMELLNTEFENSIK